MLQDQDKDNKEKHQPNIIIIIPEKLIDRENNLIKIIIFCAIKKCLFFLISVTRL